MVAVFVGDLLFQFYVFFSYSLFDLESVPFADSFSHQMLPSAVFNALFALLLYAWIQRLRHFRLSLYGK